MKPASGSMTRSATMTGSWAGRSAGLSLDWGMLSDLTARAVLVVLFSLMTIRFGQDFFATGRIAGLMLVISELLIVLMTLFRRFPDLLLAALPDSLRWRRGLAIRGLARLPVLLGKESA